MSDNVQIILLAFIKLYHVQFLSNAPSYFTMGFKNKVEESSYTTDFLTRACIHLKTKYCFKGFVVVYMYIC